MELAEEDLAMTDRTPAPGDADDDEIAAKAEAVMRAQEKHREGGVDPELEVAEADPGPDA
jgi:hypothetical protein